MKSTGQLPTFHELCLYHGISLEEIYTYAEGEISLEEIRLFDETGRANPYLADDLLFVLSQLSGQRYNRTNVSGVIFVLARPPASPTNPQPRIKYLPDQGLPTLRNLYLAYNVDLRWLCEALGTERREVEDLFTGSLISRSQLPLVEQFLQLLSQYTGVSYTPGTIQLQIWDVPGLAQSQMEVDSNSGAEVVL